MKTICTDCHVELFSDHRDADGLVSHGLCRPCLEKVMEGRGDSLDNYLNRFDVPVFVFDSNDHIVSTNEHGQVLSAKDIEDIRGNLTGDVFGCLHAEDPGGCGETIHCRTCTIRNTIMKVIENGQPCLRQPACQDLDTVIGPRKVRFLISAEKAGESVLLRIDNMEYSVEVIRS
jgi:hypothetical protein